MMFIKATMLTTEYSSKKETKAKQRLKGGKGCRIRVNVAVTHPLTRLTNRAAYF